MMTIEQRLSAIANGPQSHAVVMTFTDGRTRRREVHSEAAARNLAERESQRIGLKLKHMETGDTVIMERVDIIDLR